MNKEECYEWTRDIEMCQRRDLVEIKDEHLDNTRTMELINFLTLVEVNRLHISFIEAYKHLYEEMEKHKERTGPMF